MGNKYSSNIRTYTARNLVWNCAAAQPVPFVMAAPTALTVQTPNSATNSMQKVFYQAQYPTLLDWNVNSFINIKRVGIFCNFADGLVQKMDTSRVTMTITAAIYQQIAVTGTVDFTAGSNAVVLAGLAGPLSISNALINAGQNYPYFLQSVPALNGTAYLTDYSHATNLGANVVVLNPSAINKSKSFTINNIATLNSMYEAEVFFPYTVDTAAIVPQKLLLSCRLGIDSASATSLDFFTKTIDTAFNGQAVSFDSVIEVEVTPS